MAVDTELRLRIKAIKEGSGVKDIESELAKVQKQVNELNEDRKGNAPAITEAKNRIIDLKKNLKEAKDLEKSNIEEVKQSYRNANTEKKNLDKQAEQQRKAYDKDRANAIKENERLNTQAAKSYEKAWKEAHAQNKKFDDDAKQQRKNNFSNITGTPEELKRLRFEMALVGNEQAKLALSGQRESAQYQRNKVYLNELRTALQGVRREMQGLDAQPKMTWFQKLEVGENISSIYRGARQMMMDVNAFFGDMINRGAELSVLQQNTKLTADGLNLLRKAVAGNLDNNQLYDLYNQFDLVNVGLEDTAKILAAVESRFDVFHGDIVGGSEKIINVIQGQSKGLRALRIDTELYRKNLEALVKAQGGQIEVTKDLNAEIDISIKNLEPEIQMQLRKEAVIKTLGVTINDVNNKTQDTADVLNSVKVATRNAETQLGSFIANGLVKVIQGFGATSDAGIKAAGVMGTFGGSLSTIIQLAGSLNLALMGTGKTAISIFGKGGVWVTAIAATIAALKFMYDYIDRMRHPELNAPDEDELKDAQREARERGEQNFKNGLPSVNEEIESVKNTIRLKGDPTGQLAARLRELEGEKDFGTVPGYKPIPKNIAERKNEGLSLTQLREKNQAIENKLSGLKGESPETLAQIKSLTKENDATKKLIESKEKLLGLNQDKGGKGGQTAEQKQTKLENDALDDKIKDLQIERELLELNKNTRYKTVDAILAELDANKNLIEGEKVKNEKVLQYWRYYKQLTDDIKKIEDERKETYSKVYKEQLDYINNNIEAEKKLAKLKAENIENEYLQKRKIFEVERDDAIAEIRRMNIDSSIKEKLIEQQNKKFESENKKLSEEMKKDLVNAYVDFFDKSLGLTERLTKLLGIAPDTFIGKFLSALKEGLGIIQDIASIVDTIKTINLLLQGGAESGGGFFDIFKTLLGLGGAVASGGATLPMLGMGINAGPEGFAGWGGGNAMGGSIAPGIIKSYSNIEKSNERSSVTKDLNNTSQRTVYVETPYISETRVRGKDIEISYRKTKRIIDKKKN